MRPVDYAAPNAPGGFAGAGPRAAEPLTGSALTQDEAELLARAETAARWLDTAFRIPGTSIRFGLDPILGLVPGLGDGLSLAVSAWVILMAHGAGAPWSLLARMAGNVAIDSLVGSIPVLGDLFDVGFKANRRNADLLRAHFEARARTLG